ncbi:MAG TPA: Hsp20/alpha crystallin family protein [Candidatus Polarisedimenticolia bacterium]|nr:Hsp20/alpha crystallin family protein [Candidatus Polarisedimenticolia bacterium]
MSEPRVRIGKRPAQEASEMHRRMERVMQRLLLGLEAPGSARGWEPRADLYETASGLVVTLELPGVERDRIEILVEGLYLAVSGVREEPQPGGCVRWHQMEIAYGSFERLVALPQECDPDRITATYENGFLRIEIPRGRSAARSVPIEND